MRNGTGRMREEQTGLDSPFLPDSFHAQGKLSIVREDEPQHQFETNPLKEAF
jgi:hypothetical protein